MQRGIKVQQDWYPCNGPTVSHQKSRFELHSIGNPSWGFEMWSGEGEDRANVPECKALKKQKLYKAPTEQLRATRARVEVGERMKPK